ncbi:capsular biosynthesis protein [Aliiroseovarius sp. PTFE2010]|uniref:capsular polysaccharide export protein, LipB/KpsS family n=1 Tax=Aliiroseovarius sp. PTFE2010 TaxID=3417190 RepID=UPI003CF2F2CB
MTALEPLRRAVVIESGKRRVSKIAAGLFGAENTDIIPAVGLRPCGPSIDTSAALESATRSHQSAFGTFAKAAFLRGQANWLHARLQRASADCLVVWNGIKGHRRLAADIAAAQGITVIFLEEAPLPGRLTVDFKGVNYGNSLPRRADFYAQWVRQSGASTDGWRQIGGGIVPRQAKSGRDIGQVAADSDLGNEPYIFVPLQVPGDSQITVYGDWIKSVDHMIDVLHTASAALPDGWSIRIKEHPSAKDSFSDKLSALSGAKFRVDNQTNTMAQVAAARGVITINSSVGFEAFFCDVPVLVLGHAFYGFGDMATKVESPAALQEWLRTPDALGFDAEARGTFCTYLDQVYFPREDAILSGAYTVQNLVERERQAADILSGLAG